ncbi:MAG: 5-formyltetrahydrofolate cyclo-ligase [Phycisphaerales bacterium]|nr:5-formyltetrahydrofolate cyclo-ligase [Phycisphaerales bacterium]
MTEASSGQTSCSSQKEAMRTEMLARLAAMSAGAFAHGGTKIAGFFTAGNRVMIFAALKREPDIMALVQLLAERGVTICLPRATADGGLECVVAPPPWRSMAPDAAGVGAPVEGRLVNPAELDVVLVPGLAFGLDGGRLGRGKGYFDRFLKRVRPDALRIGICFETQIVNHVPSDPGDEPVHAILTESRFVWCKTT